MSSVAQTNTKIDSSPINWSYLFAREWSLPEIIVHWFQKACRKAREYELRAEQAETLLGRNFKNDIRARFGYGISILLACLIIVIDLFSDSKRGIVVGVKEDGSVQKENEELKRK